MTRLPDGTLGHVLAINENIPGGIETEGWDFGMTWKRDTRFGEFRLRWENAYVDYWGAIGRPARGATLPDGSLSIGNAAGSTTPLYESVWRLRSIATLGWQRDAFGASISARYFSPIKEDCSGVTYIADLVGDPSLRSLCSDPDRVVDGVPAPRNRVGAVTYVDLEGVWRAPWKGSFRMGVRNAFDREPPMAYSLFMPDYDIPGRFWWLEYRQQF
jgi:iron complex outermembrane receptor protein